MADKSKEPEVLSEAEQKELREEEAKTAQKKIEKEKASGKRYDGGEIPRS